jgi:hypothetical protein
MRYGPDSARERHNELSHGEYLVSLRLIEICREVQLIEIIGAQGKQRRELFALDRLPKKLCEQNSLTQRSARS